MRFDGKIAVVTGTSGIGLAAAIRMAQEGARVRLVGIDPSANKAAQKTVKGLEITVHEADVSSEAEVGALISRIVALEPGIDVLVNAAGIQTYGTLETTSVADWDRVMAVNLRASFLTSHFVYPHMKGRGGGSIVHVSSVQGHANQYGVLGYATTKGAVHAMTRAMAVDAAKHGIRVNSVSPGSVRTPLLEYGAKQLMKPGQTLEDVIKGFGAGHPVGRVGSVEEVAALIAFLSSDEAEFCTGGDYLVDGGLMAVLGV